MKRYQNIMKLFSLSFFFGIPTLAQSQSYLSPGYILGEIRDSLGFVKLEPAPDFVVRARAESSSLEYVPLKPPPRGFHSAAMSPAGQLQAEAKTIRELEAARAKSQAHAAGAEDNTRPSMKATKPSEDDPPPMKWNAWDTE